jgi:hypothetical protein
MREFTDQVLTLKLQTTEVAPTSPTSFRNDLLEWQASHKKLLTHAHSDMNRQRFKLEFEVPEFARWHVKQALHKATPIIVKLKTLIEREMQAVVDREADYQQGKWEQPEKSFKIVERAVDWDVANLWRTLYAEEEKRERGVNS